MNSTVSLLYKQKTSDIYFKVQENLKDSVLFFLFFWREKMFKKQIYFKET